MVFGGNLDYALIMSAKPRRKVPFHERMLLNMRVLALMLLLAALYTAALAGLPGYSNTLPGVIGILLGLYICAQPAANMLEILLYLPPAEREGLLSSASGRIWLALNLLTTLAGWGIIFYGILLYTNQAG
jgi:hypothetical protein